MKVIELMEKIGKFRHQADVYFLDGKGNKYGDISFSCLADDGDPIGRAKEVFICVEGLTVSKETVG